MPDVGVNVGGGQVEVAAGVERHGPPVRPFGLEQEVLHLGRDVEGVARVACTVHDPTQHTAGIAVERDAVGPGDVAEHAGGDLVADAAVARRHQFERLGVGQGHHVGLGDAAEALDGRAVEDHALLEGCLEFCG